MWAKFFIMGPLLETTETFKQEWEIKPESVFPEWIETDRIRFERLTEDALRPAKLRKMREKNPDFDKYFLTSETKEANYESVLEWYEYGDKLWEERTDAFYVMLTPERRDFIGTAYIEDVDFERSIASLGIWLHKDYRGEGYAQERAEALSFVCFDHLDIEVVQFKVAVDNTASVKSVTKSMKLFGGSFSGRLKNHTKIPSNEVQDVYVWTLHKDEYFDDSAEYTDTASPEVN